MIDRLHLPRIRIVDSQHDLPSADLSHQMPDRLRGEDQRIEVDLLEIFRRLLFQLHVRIASFWANQTRMIRTIGIRGQKATAMRRDHFQSGKAVEGAFKDQMRERYRRPQRISDGVTKPPVAGETFAEFGQALRMDE